ncbi:hypothetical protein MUP77_08150, partial [Candidatus Bathyarchaeota archaeon]|nr:hypothetical protein [Candidatus Bathyarchaeota archaeon]
HVRGLKTDASIKTAPKTKNKDYYHFTPISGQASARYQHTSPQRNRDPDQEYCAQGVGTQLF